MEFNFLHHRDILRLERLSCPILIERYLVRHQTEAIIDWQRVALDSLRREDKRVGYSWVRSIVARLYNLALLSQPFIRRLQCVAGGYVPLEKDLIDLLHELLRQAIQRATSCCGVRGDAGPDSQDRFSEVLCCWSCCISRGGRFSKGLSDICHVGEDV